MWPFQIDLMSSPSGSAFLRIALGAVRGRTPRGQNNLTGKAPVSGVYYRPNPPQSKALFYLAFRRFPELYT
jgi:hypothetical protein